ncbi:MAG: stage II sporulation protein M, partial [Candidatus Acidiferrum sp.]
VSLAQAGGRAAKLVLGTIPLLIVAGLIEGFFSPSGAPVSMKFGLAAVLFCALLIYLFGTGRSRPSLSLTANSAP